MNSFFRELKQRKVYRVALGYAVVAWLVIQISATVMPAYHAPEWILPIFITVIAFGFPVALVLAWAFEVKGSVIEKTTESTGSLSTANKRRVWLLAAVGLIISALAVGGYWLWHPWRNASTASEPSTAAMPTTPRKSIAVLPFENLSEDKANAYFADGIQEEILTRLAKIADLKVISRTPGETLNRDDIFLPAHASTVMYFSARKKEKGASSIYAFPLTGGEAKMIYSIDGFGTLLDVTPDGGRLLFRRMPSLNDNAIEVVDSASGKAAKLYPTKGPATINDAKFSSDGNRVFVSTDSGGNRAVLLVLDATSGKELARYIDPASATASVLDCMMPVTRDKLACVIDAGNHNEIRLLDAATLKPGAEVKLPLGSGVLTDFSDDGKSVVVAWSTPNTPTDLFVIDFKSGKVAPLRNEPRPSISELPPLEVGVSEVTAHDGLKIPVHAFLPAGAKTGRKLPTIINYHGGPANVSQIRWNVGARFFTSLGYVWVEPNVRGSTGYGRAYVMADDGAKRREALKDIETTGKWVATQPWADKDRIVIYGGSYGG
jgi:Prolyl oligopeptidase family